MAENEEQVEHNVRHLDREPNDPRTLVPAETGWHLNDEGVAVQGE